MPQVVAWCSDLRIESSMLPRETVAQSRRESRHSARYFGGRVVGGISGRTKGDAVSDDLVKHAREALEGATPGPWHVYGNDPWNMTVNSSVDNRVCFMAHSNGLNDERDEANARLIAAARDLVPDMADRIEALTAERDALREGARFLLRLVTGKHLREAGITLDDTSDIDEFLRALARKEGCPHG